jgi:KaiC/GvpD/RAD55 family RecA-like ATPase
MNPPFTEYVQAGMSCIPIKADGSKSPALPWKEYQQRLATLDEAGRWERSFQGVALVGGAVSGNLEILDVDEPSLVRPLIDALKAQDAGLIHKLCFIRTPRANESGQHGCHLVYRCETAVTGNTKLAMSEPKPEVDAEGNPVVNPATGEQNTKPRCLIETRGEGGYALTVGCSPKCHPTGNLYEHVYGAPLTELSVLTIGERETLHNAARLFDRSIAETHTEPEPHGYERAYSTDSPGDEFNRGASWPEILEPHGWRCVGESGGIKRWRRPGKAAGYSASTGLLSKQGNELLVVFSTNAHPFEGVNPNGRSGVSYSKFGAYALLNHRGDFEEAAKALVKLGYGSPPKKAERQTRVLKTTVRDCERRYFEFLKTGTAELVSLGVPTLDKAIGGGVERGEMVVVGGLTSHGKTVCGLQALRAMIDAGRHGILVSHEMGGIAIAKRMICARTPLESRYWAQYIESLIEESRIYWDGRGEIFLLECCRNVEDIEQQVTQIINEYDVGMIVVDHAQLTIAKGSTRYEQLTNASGRFKELAVKHDCVCLVLSQLNREAARQGDAAAYHLRETGALEQDADVVILVRWPWKVKQEGDPHEYVFKIEKNRNRAIVRHEVVARFRPSRQVIDTAADETREEIEVGQDGF